MLCTGMMPGEIRLARAQSPAPQNQQAPLPEKNVNTVPAVPPQPPAKDDDFPAFADPVVPAPAPAQAAPAAAKSDDDFPAFADPVTPAAPAPAAAKSDDDFPAFADPVPPQQQQQQVPVATTNDGFPAMDMGNGSGEEAPKFITKEGPAGKITYVERPEDSQLSVEFLMDDRTTLLDPTFPIYQANEVVLMPLGRFLRLISFPINVDTSRAAADGWFLHPKNTFHLSAPYKEVEIGGKKQPVKGGIVETHLDDIYVSTDLLAQWFPLDVTLNYNELRLYLKTREPLPFQEQAQRRSEWLKRQRADKQQAKQQPGQNYDPKDVINLPYRMYSVPIFQVTHSLGDNMAGGTSTITGSTAINGQADLFGMSGRFSGSVTDMTGTGVQFSSPSFNLSREDYSGGLLGKLHATRYELGDLTTGSFPLAGQQNGRGVLVTNEPYNFVSDASKFQLQGFGPAGWDVEVYQNNELLAFSTLAADGKYSFTALPLNQGFNFFKIILYGPSGEREERYDRYYLGQDMVEKGKFIYNASALQSSTPLFNILGSTPAKDTRETVSLTGQYGVTKAISATGGLFHGPVNSTTMLDGVGAGIRASSSSAYTQLNSFFDKSGGRSYSGLITGNVTDTISFNAQRTEHHDFAPGVYNTLTDTSVQVSKMFTFSNKIIPSLNVSMQGQRLLHEDGIVENRILNRLATSFLGLSVTNELEKDMFTGPSPDVYQGHLTARARLPYGFGTMHTDFAYTFAQPKPVQLTSATAVLQNDIAKNLALTTTLSHTFGTVPLTKLSTSLDWNADKARIGIAAGIASDKSRQIGLTMSYNLVPRSLTGDYAMSGGSSDINTGSLLLRPFIDSNGDGKYEAGEEMVKDAVFRNALRGSTGGKVGKDGLATMNGLTPNLVNRIQVDDKSVLDLSLAPEKPELLVMGKSGVNGPIDFPFSKTGDVSGTLYYVDTDGSDKALESAHIFLQNKEGKQVMDTYSEYDGYFGFEKVPIGCYRMVFPLSDDLKTHYTGDGEGPWVNVSFTSPDVANLELRFKGGEIVPENLPPETDGCGTQKQEKRAQMDESIFSRMQSIGLKLKEIQPGAGDLSKISGE